MLVTGGILNPGSKSVTKDEAMDANLRTGGHILIEQLALHGADTVFGVPGESFLAALDGMYQSQRVRFINARHEGGAAMMADAYGKLTGRPGSCSPRAGPAPPMHPPAFMSHSRIRRP